MGFNRSSTKNGTEREDHSSTQNGTKRDGTERERNDKKEERERKDLAEGPCSRTERNDFKKVGTCPALDIMKQNSDILSIFCDFDNILFENLIILLISSCLLLS